MQAFDFCYTETQMYSGNKRVARAEKVHELTAMLFSTSHLKIKSLLISPRDMVLEADEGAPSARADPDVDDVMRPDTAQKDEDEDDDDDEEQPAADAEPSKDKASETDSERQESEDSPAEPEEELDVLSDKFNKTFVVETLDVTQTAEVIDPALKSLLLKHPDFIVDFQENRFLIYREYTFEAEDYSTVLELGKKILGALDRELPMPSAEPALSDSLKVFVSRSKLEDTP